MTTTQTPQMTDEQSHRLSTLRHSDEPLPERLEALAELAEDIAEDSDHDAEDFIGEFATREVVGTTPMGGCLMLPKVLEDLREFTDYFDEFGAEGDDEFVDEVSLNKNIDFVNQAYYTLSALYTLALKDLVTEDERVYEAVYRRMYDLVRDPRPVLYQISMEYEYGCTKPKNFVEYDIGIEWEMENVDDIARALIEVWMGLNYSGEREFYDLERVREERTDPVYDRDLDAIIRDVECGDCPARNDD